jgi:vacuolar-type H+-ATPase subunit F/Vma7
MGTGRIAALGEWARIRGFALAGVQTLAAQDPEAVRAAWDALDGDVIVVILTTSAADALGEKAWRGPLTVVLPP